MSNLSDIGFPVRSDEDVNQILMDVLPFIEQKACRPFGFYYRFSDASGSQLYLQANPDQDLVGFNPAFDSGSAVEAEVLRKIERDTSPMDGAFVARLGNAVIVFDTPDFRSVEDRPLPSRAEVSFTAFASNDLSHRRPDPGDEPGIRMLRGEPESLVDPSGEEIPPQAHVRISATVAAAESRENSLTGSRFFAFTIDIGGLRLDAVADPSLIKETPLEGDVLEGSFWLSGKLVRWLS